MTLSYKAPDSGTNNFNVEKLHYYVSLNEFIDASTGIRKEFTQTYMAPDSGTNNYYVNFINHKTWSKNRQRKNKVNTIDMNDLKQVIGARVKDHI